VKRERQRSKSRLPEGVAENSDEFCAIVIVECGIGSRSWNIDGFSDAFGDVVADAVELDDYVGFYDRGLDVRDFEGDGVDEELLLHGDERVEEEEELGPDVCEGWGGST
jgi:hypothetical protein